MIAVTPSTSFEAVAQFDTGLTGTLGVRVIDNVGATTIARTTAGITEYPAGSGVYQKTLTSPATIGQYTLVWDDAAAEPNYATDDLLVTGLVTDVVIVVPGDLYVSVEELARILKIRAPSAEQTVAMERVLSTAAGEINAEIDLAADADALTGWQLALAAEVNLERAVEHWRQQESPFGLIGLGPELGATHTAKDSWERHANKLAPLKDQWGLA